MFRRLGESIGPFFNRKILAADQKESDQFALLAPFMKPMKSTRSLRTEVRRD